MKLSLGGAPVINDYQAALKAARDDVTLSLRLPVAIRSGPVLSKTPAGSTTLK
jgi:hypothetical protein